MLNGLKALMSYLGKALSEDNEHPSAMRIMTFYVVMCFASALTIGFLYVVFTLAYKELVIIYAGMLMATLLSGIGLKKLAKKDEEKVVTEVENGTP